VEFALGRGTPPSPSKYDLGCKSFILLRLEAKVSPYWAGDLLVSIAIAWLRSKKYPSGTG